MEKQGKQVPAGFKPVVSSNVQAVRYDATTRVLWVQYIHGEGVYRYFDVEEELAMAMLKASSIGSFINARIKTPERKFEKCTSTFKCAGCGAINYTREICAACNSTTLDAVEAAPAV